MKALTALVAASTLLAACQEEESSEGEPVVIYNFFSIISSSTQEDFFLNNPTLRPEDVTLFMKNWSDEWVDLEVKPTELNGRTVFGPAFFVDAAHFLYKLELTGSDTDTIRVVATGDANYDDVFEFYYNGRLTDRYDFSNQEFYYDYVEANAAYDQGKARALPDKDTYILTFEKVVSDQDPG